MSFASRLCPGSPPVAGIATVGPAPPSMFKDLDDEILGDALIIHDKQVDRYELSFSNP